MTEEELAGAARFEQWMKEEDEKDIPFTMPTPKDRTKLKFPILQQDYQQCLF